MSEAERFGLSKDNAKLLLTFRKSHEIHVSIDPCGLSEHDCVLQMMRRHSDIFATIQPEYSLRVLALAAEIEADHSDSFQKSLENLPVSD